MKWNGGPCGAGIAQTAKRSVNATASTSTAAASSLLSVSLSHAVQEELSAGTAPPHATQAVARVRICVSCAAAHGEHDRVWPPAEN